MSFSVKYMQLKCMKNAYSYGWNWGQTLDYEQCTKKYKTIIFKFYFINFIMILNENMLPLKINKF